MIVMKFGGTSVQDAAAIRNVARLVLREKPRGPLVVVSACAGVTNELLGIAQKSMTGNLPEALTRIASLQQRHCNIATELFQDERNRAARELTQKVFARNCAELEKLAQSVAVLKELTPRARDQFAAFGEQWSSLLLCHELLQFGHECRLLDARTVMVTDNDFTRAAPYFDQITAKARETISPLLQQQNIVVTQGFIGATTEGLTTTIGRGGSDYSAAIFGATLNAEEIQIWTDVDGILTADPYLLPHAHRIKQLTFNEAAELAYFGAKVLHPSTILPAIEKNIPVRVLNSKRPEGEGTRITNSTVSPSIVKSIAYKEGITLITVRSTRMLMAHGFFARLFEVFAAHKKSLGVIATSEVGVSLTVDDPTHLDDILRELRTFAEVQCEPKRAVICVVGEKFKAARGIVARVFAALHKAGVKLELISFGGSEINLTFVVAEAQITTAVQCLHKELFAEVSAWPEIFE